MHPHINVNIPDMIRIITGMRNEDIVFIGDRLYTDIAIGVNNGVTSLIFYD